MGFGKPIEYSPKIDISGSSAVAAATFAGGPCSDPGSVGGAYLSNEVYRHLSKDPQILQGVMPSETRGLGS